MMFFFFFKQKTAYEMRISDWSSDVCSSDLERNGLENLTLRNLATKLGVSAPSLYHHFANKTEVLRAAAKELVRDVPAPRVTSLNDWKGWFKSMALNVYKHVMQRPRASALLFENFPHAMVFPFRNRR